MALSDVIAYRVQSEIHGQLFGKGPKPPVDRTSHFAFGTKTQEFAVPVGADVSTTLLFDILIIDTGFRVV